MTIYELFQSGIINDKTEILIRNTNGHEFQLLAKGNWYEDQILDYICKEYLIDSFTWEKENKIYIDIIEYADKD